MKRRHTVLVVDDEADVVASVKDLLRLDYKVLGATKAVEGLAVLDREPIHVVMTDQRMPEMTGVQLLEQVRDKHPDAMRLLFTGYADVRAVVDAINRGNVYRYITKPWDPDELMAIIREACDRYDLIEERRHLIAQLQTKNVELEQVNAELRRMDELKSAFIRVASHELRTPLTILMGLSDLAYRQGNAAEPLCGWVKRMHGAGQRLQHLIDQLVNMLAAQQFDRTIEKHPTDLGNLVRRAVEDVRPFADIRGHKLQIEVPPDTGTIEVDEGKIRDSVNHLLLNAIKFTPDGGTITVGAGRAADGSATIRVSDTGCGIDPQCLDRVFDRFFTDFDVSRHSSGHFEHGKKGIGLGLSVVKAFVEMHGGRVEVQSDTGRGATFTIRLPAQSGANQPAPAAAQGVVS
ncbi:MAG TPA: hybrid sensor histidine kinase/response regulator [Tepidisphaeraceae bacterium]|jgi:signal transduction histidine kinase